MKARRTNAKYVKAKKASKACRQTSVKSAKAVKSKASVKKPVVIPAKTAKNTSKTQKKAVGAESTKPTEEQQIFMQKIAKILSDSRIRQNLISIGGENALAIVRNFYGSHSDEEFAKKLKIKISDVRATLNKLHNEGLVNYIREKDNETGWYSYSWSLNHERMEKWANSQSSHFGAVDNEEGGDYYFCPACGAATITNFESALTVDFKCERCNRLLEFIDEKKMSELCEKTRV